MGGEEDLGPEAALEAMFQVDEESQKDRELQKAADRIATRLATPEGQAAMAKAAEESRIRTAERERAATTPYRQRERQEMPVVKPSVLKYPPITPGAPIVWAKWGHDSRASDEDKMEAAKTLVAELIRTNEKSAMLPRNGAVIVAERTSEGILLYDCEIKRKAVVR